MLDPMRRLLVLLLALILSIQMTWAASHFCDDGALIAQSVASAGEGGHDHAVVTEELSGTQAEKIADACCGAAHGCHGLHHLMGQEDPAVTSTASTPMPAPSGAAPPLTEVRSRIERPNWLAA